MLQKFVHGSRISFRKRAEGTYNNLPIEQLFDFGDLVAFLIGSDRAMEVRHAVIQREVVVGFSRRQRCVVFPHVVDYHGCFCDFIGTISELGCHNRKWKERNKSGEEEGKGMHDIARRWVERGVE